VMAHAALLVRDEEHTRVLTENVTGVAPFITFPRNKNAALPVRAQKAPLTISGLKKWLPDGAFGHELSRPKRVSWLLADGMK